MEGAPPVRAMGLSAAVTFVLLFSAAGILSLPGASAATISGGPRSFRVAMGPMLLKRDNPLHLGYSAEYMNAWSVVDGLVSYDGDLRQVPWLAQPQNTPYGTLPYYRVPDSLDPNDPNQLDSYTGDLFIFNIARNAYFMDPANPDDLHRPVRAYDVAHSYQMLIDLHNGNNPSPALDVYATSMAYATEVGPFTVQVKWKQPYAGFYSAFASIPVLPFYNDCPAFCWANLSDPNTFDPNPLVGSGPYLSYQADQQAIELRKNPHFWGKLAFGLDPRPDIVHYTAHPTEGAALQALVSAKVDMGIFSQGQRSLGGQATPITRFDLATPGLVYKYGINVATPEARALSGGRWSGQNNPALLRQEVRTAIAMTTDRDSLVSNGLSGFAKKGETLVPSAHPGHYDVPTDQEVVFNVSAARKLLNAKGWVYDGDYAFANGGVLKYNPNATTLANDWHSGSNASAAFAQLALGTDNPDGKICTDFFCGEILQFRFMTQISPLRWATMYRMLQGWAHVAGIDLLDTCPTGIAGCGLLSSSVLAATLWSLSYDLWLSPIMGLDARLDVSDILWLQTSFAYPDNGYRDPVYDAHYVTSTTIADPALAICRRKGVDATLDETSVAGLPDGACASYTITLPNGTKQPYHGTDFMQRKLFDYASYIVIAYGVSSYMMHGLRWSGYGDWNVHQYLAPDFSYYWLYFQISPNDQRAPLLAPLPSFQGVSFAGATTTLRALALDPENRPLRYEWDLDESADTNGDGNPVNDVDVACPASAAATYTCSSDGSSVTIPVPTITTGAMTYGINARVTDRGTRTDGSDTWMVKGRSTLQISPTTTPVIRIGGVSYSPQAATWGENVSFFASAVDQSGAPVNFLWAFGDGTWGQGQSTAHRYNAPGTYAVTVFVSAPDAAPRFRTVALQVRDNTPPYVPPLPSLQTLDGVPLNFSALAMDADPQDGLSYAWDFGDGTTATGPTATHTYPVTGTYANYTYTLTVGDGRGHVQGNSGVAYVTRVTGGTMTISSFTYVPFGTSRTYTDQPITFIANATHPGGFAMLFTFDFGDGSRDVRETPPTSPGSLVTVSVVHSYALSGRITATLTVNDTINVVGKSTVIGVQLNSPTQLYTPLPHLRGFVGTPVTYTFRPFDPDTVTDVTILYTLSDQDAGAPVSGSVLDGQAATVNRVYSKPGTKNVALTLNDQHGHVNIFTTTTIILGTLADWPFPFVTSGDVSGTVVVGLAQLHFGRNPSNTIDVVSGVALAGAWGALTRTSTSGLASKLDTEAVDANGARVTAGGNLLALGGRGVNQVTFLYNSSMPIRVEAGSKFGLVGPVLYDTENGHKYQKTTGWDYFMGYPVTDYSYLTEIYDTQAQRYIYIVAGLSGFATRAAAQLIALGIPSLSQGTGVIIRLNDTNGDAVYETYQVIDGTGGITPMASAAAFPSPSVVAKSFIIGIGIAHFGRNPSNTIDVVGAIPYAVAAARNLTSGRLWSYLDTEAVSSTGSTITLGGDLVSVGGRGVNQVTFLINSSLPIRFDPGAKWGYVGPVIHNYVNSNTWQKQPSGSDYFQGVAILDYALDAAIPQNGRTIEVVAGFSGFATRAACQALAYGVVGRGAHQAIVIALYDADGDGTYEAVGLADWA